MAVALTLAALAAIAWVAPHLRPTPTKFANPPHRPESAVAPMPVLPLPVEAEAPALVQRARPQRPRPSGIPLDAQVAAAGEDFEVLSASELDAISQARGD